MRRRSQKRAGTAFRWAVLLIILGLWASGCREHSERLPERAQRLVEEVRQQYCPDGRLHVLVVDGEVVGDRLILRGETTSPEAYAELLRRLEKAYPRKTIVNQMRLLPDSALGDSTWALVNISVANLRREPRHSAELLNQMLLGSPVRLFKRHHDWFFARAEDGYLGWTDDGGIWITDSLGVARWMQSPRVIVTTLETSAWRSPTETDLPVSDLVAGDVLLLLERRSGWLKIQFPDGRTGWMRSAHAQPIDDFLRNARPKPEHIVSTAMRFIGRPYLWGGKSPKGLDCSGFTCAVFRLNGIILPRDANMQAQVGQVVPIDSTLEQLRPGDLVFFGPRPDRITHVGLYIGDGRFIHSDSHIRINSLRPSAPDFSPYRFRNLRAARRVFPELVRDPNTGWYWVRGMEIPKVW